MEEITTFINSCGFPIACCCAMFWYMKTEVGALRDVMEKNTIVLEKIMTLLGQDKEVEKEAEHE